MRAVIFVVIGLFLVSCASQASNPEPAVTLIPTSIPTSTVIDTPTVDVIPTAIKITSILAPTQTQEPNLNLDFSAVTLFEVTHLMDPKFFQVTLANWPPDLPDSVKVYIDDEEYDCEVLFPDKFPDRVYCWGLAPERGAEVNLQVIVTGGGLPVFEIPFLVPYPGAGGDG